MMTMKRKQKATSRGGSGGSSIHAGSPRSSWYRQLLFALLLSIGALTLLTACSDDDDDNVSGGAGTGETLGADTSGAGSSGGGSSGGGSSGGGSSGGGSSGGGSSGGGNGGAGNGGESPLVGLYTGVVNLTITGADSGILNLPISINVQENGQATITIGSGSDTVSVNLDTGALGTANLLVEVTNLLNGLLSGLGVLSCEPLGLAVVNADVDIGAVTGNVNVNALNCTVLGLPVNLNVSAGAFTAN